MSIQITRTLCCDLCGEEGPFDIVLHARQLRADAAKHHGWRRRFVLQPAAHLIDICPACWKNAQEEEKHNGGNLE